MSKAVFLCDYDNTLAHHSANGSSVSQADKDAIHRFRANGNIFVISTGRGYSVIMPEIRKHSVEIDYLSCNSGGLIIDDRHQIVSEHVFDRETATAVEREFRKSKAQTYGACDRDCIVYGRSDIWRFPAEENVSDITDIDEFIEKKNVIGFFSGFPNGEERSRLKDAIDSLNLNCEAMLSGPASVDVSAKGVTKSLSVKELHERFPGYRMYAMGDAMADATMFVDPAVSIAIKSGTEELKKLASFTFDSVGEALAAVEEERI